MPKLAQVILYAVGVTCVVIVCVYLVWWARSRYMVLTAKRRQVRASRASLWQDPGDVERLDFRAGPGGSRGAPEPPFRFVAEHATGSNPCLSVRDARDRTWRIKWGDEVRSET